MPLAVVLRARREGPLRLKFYFNGALWVGPGAKRNKYQLKRRSEVTTADAWWDIMIDPTRDTMH